MKNCFSKTIAVIYFVFLSIEVFPCAVCGGAYSQKTLDAYFGITIFLSLLPIVMASTFGFYLFRKFKKNKVSSSGY